MARNMHISSVAVPLVGLIFSKSFMARMPSGVAALFKPNMLAAMFMAMWSSFHHGGFYHFEGGSQALSDAMAEVIEDNGGAIELNTEATRIVIENGRATQVQAADGRCFDARYVVSNAPAPVTIFDLVGRENLPSPYVERVEGMEVGATTFVLYLGVDHDYAAEFAGTHELMVGATSNEEENAEAIASCDPERVGLGIINYTVIDPTTAPEGKSVITITTILPYECFDEWEWNVSREAYRERKEAVAQVLLARVEELLPDLTSHVEVMEVGTPQTIRAFTLNPRGAIVGWSNTPDQSLTNRLSQVTPIENLFLVGAWTFPGGGQSAVMSGGRSAANLVLEAESGE